MVEQLILSFICAFSSHDMLGDLSEWLPCMPAALGGISLHRIWARLSFLIKVAGSMTNYGPFGCGLNSKDTAYFRINVRGMINED